MQLKNYQKSTLETLEKFPKKEIKKAPDEDEPHKGLFRKQ
jgi:hypothetical protein